MQKNFRLFYISFFFVQKAKLQVPKLSFVRLSWDRTTDKLALNWQISLELDSNTSANANALIVYRLLLDLNTNDPFAAAY